MFSKGLELLNQSAIELLGPPPPPPPALPPQHLFSLHPPASHRRPASPEMELRVTFLSKFPLVPHHPGIVFVGAPLLGTLAPFLRPRSLPSLLSLTLRG